MKVLKYILRFIAAILGAVGVFFALAVPIGIISICWEGGCTNTQQEHWLRDLLALGFIGFALCVSSLVIAAALFSFARYGAFAGGILARRQCPSSRR